ncbi:MAG: response regulator [Paracoccaceae bacterium]
MHILIVEDEALLARDLEAGAEDRGHTVAGPASSVAAALPLVTEGLDAAVLDINLREGRSFPVARACLALGVPFVFLTGYAAMELPEDLADAERLVKPVRHDRLFAALSRRDRGPRE